MKLAIRIARTSDGQFRAACPALPGCVVWGQTYQEAEEKINKAVCGYLASMNVALPRELGKLANLCA